MKKKMAKAVSIALTATMCLSMAACGDKKEDAKKDGKTITFWNVGTEGADKEIYEYAIQQFEKNTSSGYKIDNVPTQNDKYKEKLVIAMSSGECPDMYTTWTGGPMNEYIDSGYAQPLDDLYAKYNVKDRFMEGSLAQASYNGHIYAVPVKNISVAGIYYNKTLFEENGLSVPKTVSELEAACDKFVENGIIPFALANGPKWTGSMYFQSLAARKGGLEPFQAAAAGNGSFEDECFVYAGEKIQEWVDKGYFPDGFNSMSEDDGQAAALFYQEKAAMYLIGSWKTAAFKTDTTEAGSDLYDRIGWFNFPAVDGSSADASIMCGTLGDQFISFNCTDDKLDAAFEFTTYLSTEDTIQKMLDASLIPPVKGIESKITDPLSKDIITAANNAGAVQLWYDQYLTPSVANAHLDGNQEVFGLTKTPEEANKMMQDAMTEASKQ